MKELRMRDLVSESKNVRLEWSKLGIDRDIEFIVAYSVRISSSRNLYKYTKPAESIAYCGTSL